MPSVAEQFRFSEVEKDSKEFMSEMGKLCKVYRVGDIDQAAFMKACNKDVLATNLGEALKLIERQHQLIINQRVKISQQQENVVKLQDDVITAQKQTIEKTSHAVNGMKHAVTQCVQESVKNSVSKSYDAVVKTVGASVETSVKKSYSDVMQSGIGSSGSGTFDKDTLKSVAKQVIVEEELSRNVMVFGLPESEEEDLSVEVSEVFRHLEEKPRFEAARLGKSKPETARPVKVTLSSSTAAQLILSKSRKLKESEKYKTVFLSPDRTAEERVKHWELVAEMKRRNAEEPQKRHIIKAGEVICAD